MLVAAQSRRMIILIAACKLKPDIVIIIVNDLLPICYNLLSPRIFRSAIDNVLIFVILNVK